MMDDSALMINLKEHLEEEEDGLEAMGSAREDEIRKQNKRNSEVPTKVNTTNIITLVTPLEENSNEPF